MRGNHKRSREHLNQGLKICRRVKRGAGEGATVQKKKKNALPRRRWEKKGARRESKGTASSSESAARSGIGRRLEWEK